MKRILAAAAVALCFASSAAMAQERVGSAALGALSGAVVLGPIGAVAGAAIGYTAGPAIARSWGVGRSSSSRPAHVSRQSADAPSGAPNGRSPSLASSAPAQNATQKGVAAKPADSGTRSANSTPRQEASALPSADAQGFE
jgi:hypothetical protein